MEIYQRPLTSRGLRCGEKLTISLLARWCFALSDFPGLLEVDVPGFLLTLFVFQLEGKDGLALVHGFLSLGFARGESCVDGLEGLR